MAISEQDSATTTAITSSAGSWTLDPAATTIVLHTRAMWGVAKVRATFAALEGAGHVAADGQVSGTLIVDAASVDSGTKKRDDHLRSKDFFEVETHPTFVYTVGGARPEADGTVALQGTLTVHGITKPVEVLATLTAAGPDRATVAAAVDIDRSQWGISWTKMGARLDNHILISAVFTRRAS